jgi:exodeoxyribonuclease VII small subunit
MFMDFEARLKRLEELAGQIQSGEVSLENAVSYFEEGMKLARSLEKDLSRIEKRIEMVSKEPVSEGEKPILELFPELNED